jgi:hypothetical protein
MARSAVFVYRVGGYWRHYGNRAIFNNVC